MVVAAAAAGANSVLSMVVEVAVANSAAVAVVS